MLLRAAARAFCCLSTTSLSRPLEISKGKCVILCLSPIFLTCVNPCCHRHSTQQTHVPRTSTQRWPPTEQCIYSIGWIRSNVFSIRFKRERCGLLKCFLGTCQLGGRAHKIIMVKETLLVSALSLNNGATAHHLRAPVLFSTRDSREELTIRDCNEERSCQQEVMQNVGFINFRALSKSIPQKYNTLEVKFENSSPRFSVCSTQDSRECELDPSTKANCRHNIWRNRTKERSMVDITKTSLNQKTILANY